jgi:hypothetical protein
MFSSWGKAKHTVPDGTTFFASTKHKFDAVPVSEDGKISTMPFLEASDDFAKIFQLVSSTTLGAVHSVS